MGQASSAPDVSRARIISIAESWLGTPYRVRLSIKGVGADCLGLLRGVFSELYGVEAEKPPHYSGGWRDINPDEIMLRKAREYLVEKARTDILPGDVLVFRMIPRMPAKHCAIMSYDGTMIHALSEGRVEEIPLGQPYNKCIVGVFEFPGVKD